MGLQLRWDAADVALDCPSLPGSPRANRPLTDLRPWRSRKLLGRDPARLTLILLAASGLRALGFWFNRCRRLDRSRTLRPDSCAKQPARLVLLETERSRPLRHRAGVTRNRLATETGPGTSPSGADSSAGDVRDQSRPSNTPGWSTTLDCACLPRSGLQTRALVEGNICAGCATTSWAPARSWRRHGLRSRTLHPDFPPKSRAPPNVMGARASAPVNCWFRLPRPGITATERVRSARWFLLANVLVLRLRWCPLFREADPPASGAHRGPTPSITATFMTIPEARPSLVAAGAAGLAQGELRSSLLGHGLEPFAHRDFAARWFGSPVADRDANLPRRHLDPVHGPTTRRESSMRELADRGLRLSTAQSADFIWPTRALLAADRLSELMRPRWNRLCCGLG